MLAFKENFKHTFKNLWWWLHNLECINFKSTFAFVRNLKKLAVRLNLPSPRHPSVSVCATRGEASPSWHTGCCSTRAAPPTAGTESQPHKNWAGRTLSLHRSRFHLFTVVLALHTGSGNRNKKVLSVSQTHPPTRVRGCSTHPLKRPWASTGFKHCLQQLSLQEKWFKSYWHTPGRTRSRRLLCSF